MKEEIVGRYIEKMCGILHIKKDGETIYTAERKMRLTRTIEDYPTLDWVLRGLHDEHTLPSDMVDFLEDMFDQCFIKGK